jgi:polysaccharide export outer membrane protein
MSRMLLGVLTLFIFGSFAVAQDSYKIRPGDVLRMEVLEDQSLNRDAIVLPDGTVTVPLIGSVRVGGQSVDSVRDSISAGLAPNFASQPTVFVTVSSLAQVQPPSVSGASTIDIYVMGEVGSPGKASVEPGTSLLQFLAQSGGFTKFAATKRIQVRRTDPKTGQPVIYSFNYRAVEQGKAAVNSIILRDGDIIVVPERRLFE